MSLSRFNNLRKGKHWNLFIPVRRAAVALFDKFALVIFECQKHFFMYRICGMMWSERMTTWIYAPRRHGHTICSLRWITYSMKTAAWRKGYRFILNIWQSWDPNLNYHICFEMGTVLKQERDSKNVIYVSPVISFKVDKPILERKRWMHDRHYDSHIPALWTVPKIPQNLSDLRLSFFFLVKWEDNS